MGNGYVRQSAADIVNDAVINAAPLNAEFNAIRDAFDGSTGHSHDGTVGEGQQIDLATAVTGILPEANGGTGVNNGAALIAGKANKAGDTFTGPLMNTTALTSVDPTSMTAYPLSVWSNSNRGATGSNNLSGVGLNIANFSPSIRMYDRTSSSLSSLLITDNSNFAIFAENAAGTEWTSMFQLNLANGQAFLGANRIIDAPQLAAHTSLTNNPHAVTADQVGLGNVNNTSDADKPVSTATTTALALKANLASPALTGNPTAPTQAVNNNSTRIATTAYADRVGTNALTTAAGLYPRLDGGNAGQLGGFRNKIINPNGAINQRRLFGAYSNGIYREDRWKGHSEGKEQVIAQFNIPAGTYTLSWTGGGNGRLNGSTPAASPITATIPGTGNVSVIVPTGATAVQVEAGSVVTPLEVRPIELETMLCMAYFQKTFPQTTPISANQGFNGAVVGGAVGSVIISTWTFSVPMRVIPTLVAYNVANDPIPGWRNFAGDNITYPASIHSVTERCVNITGSGVANNQYHGIHFIASAEL